MENVKSKVAELAREYNLDMVFLFVSQATENIHSKTYSTME